MAFSIEVLTMDVEYGYSVLSVWYTYYAGWRVRLCCRMLSVHVVLYGLFYERSFGRV
jgi:hypothetical protein